MTGVTALIGPRPVLERSLGAVQRMQRRETATLLLGEPLGLAPHPLADVVPSPAGYANFDAGQGLPNRRIRPLTC